ncbi:hypothetical protein Leryth_001842 [Lithospermum erythrorhizon]|uniref:NAC domain-containing protein n=1 Tax=Lithospermum erythrorhizon TaxID=34254 RepID=A0AAV3NL91_LITER|nr:hypothetical protein Leryth_001842 [Lithospermum erythrorhizon]
MMMGGGANNEGQLSVPPGFRFHPTDEELLYYYLRKKVSYEPIDLDVIREVDLNKLEPWDLKEKCRIGSGPQNEWYFFSHKDKKYPTGTRTNRATVAGFWKATGRDKAIFLSNSKRIGMRKTLVFYTGRAPHGQKSDWIMHEYRLDDDNNNNVEVQEDGWVVCRVFKKKNFCKIFQPDLTSEEHMMSTPMMKPNTSTFLEHHQHSQIPHEYNTTNTFDGSMHLPPLLNTESTIHHPSFLTQPLPLSNMDLECSQNLLRLTTGGGSGGSCSGLMTHHHHQQDKYFGDWSFLDKLLTSNHMDQSKSHHFSQASEAAINNNPSTHQRFPYLGFEPDLSKFPK